MGKLSLSLTGQLKPPAKLLDSEPTHASRYWIVAQLLKQLSPSGKPRVLDVGGKNGLLADISRITPTIIDLEKSDEPNFVQGNALAMPFDDNSYDVVITCDVLEHIDNKDRKKFIEELTRVAKHHVIISAPFDNPGVSKAEFNSDQSYYLLTGDHHRWLKEHIETGLPNEKQIEKFLTNQGVNYEKFRHFSLDLWELIVAVHFAHSQFGDSKAISGFAKEIYKNYYLELCNYDISNRGYRTFYIVTKKGEVVLSLPKESELQKRKERFKYFVQQSLLTCLVEEAKQARSQIQNEQKTRSLLAQVATLQKEISDIKSSQSWKLARQLSKYKSALQILKTGVRKSR